MRKAGLILDKPSHQQEDGSSGAYGDGTVVNNKAYIFCFTQG